MNAALAGSPVHLLLTIRQSRSGAFCIRGDLDRLIGLRFPTGREAELAIKDYCREHGCTAFVQIYFPPGILWREDWIGVDGGIRSAYGGGRQNQRG